MAEVRLLHMDPTTGFPCEIDPNADSITLNGLTMTGNVDMGTNSITNLADGVNPADAVNFGQLTAVANGLDYKASVRTCSAGDLAATFSAVGGANGKGQFTGAPTTVDGIAIAAGDRILVKDQTNAEENGIYVVTATTTIWDRADDHDDDPEVTEGNTVWVGEGNTCADTRWTLSTNDPITVNTTGQVWVQTSGGGSVTGGDGIDVTGTIVSVDLSATPCLQFNAGQLEVLADPAGGILCTAAGLALNVGDGLEIAANTVQVDLEPATPGLQFVSGDLAFLPDPAGAIVVSGAGAAVQVDGTTIQINGSNQLEVVSAGDAERLCNSFTAAEALAVGDPVYATTTNNNVGRADAAVLSEAMQYMGLAKAAVAATNPVEIISDGLAAGVLTGGGFSAGDYVYIASGGGLTNARPTTSGEAVMYLGQAMNADDLMLRPQFMGKIS